VAPDLFATLGIKPLLGRWFVAEEEKPGIRAAIISHSLWQRQFGGDPNIVGRSLTLGGRPFNVVGVMPTGFQFVRPAGRAHSEVKVLYEPGRGNR
jgi:putative ABC transport system permease protein